MTEVLGWNWFELVGFKPDEWAGVKYYWMGKPYCRLFIFEGYHEGNMPVTYWACVGKYQTNELAAHFAAHFEHIIKTCDDVRNVVRVVLDKELPDPLEVLEEQS